MNSQQAPPKNIERSADTIGYQTEIDGRILRVYAEETETLCEGKPLWILYEYNFASFFSKPVELGRVKSENQAHIDLVSHLVNKRRALKLDDRAA